MLSACLWRDSKKINCWLRHHALALLSWLKRVPYSGCFWNQMGIWKIYYCFLEIYRVNLWCINFPNNLLKLGSNNIVLQLLHPRLSSFLNTGILFAIFIVSGNVSVQKLRLIIFLSGFESSFLNVLSIFVGMLLDPYALAAYMFYIVSSTSFWQVGLLGWT